MVVVLSAMAGETDRLLGLGQGNGPLAQSARGGRAHFHRRTVSVALFCLACQALGYDARSLLGFQVKITTDHLYGKARILGVDDARIRHQLQKGRIVTVAGFQGLDEKGNITTLGRGGSDTTAVALAASLKADVCEIFTDVNGVYTTDPHLYPKPASWIASPTRDGWKCPAWAPRSWKPAPWNSRPNTACPFTSGTPTTMKQER
jgi:aspartate kinase